VSAQLLSVLFLLVNVVLLHRLSLLVLDSAPLSFLSAGLFCVASPAATFHLTGLYSEGAFACAALTGMLLRERGAPPLLVALCFAVATTIRGNGYLLAGFFVFDAIQHVRRAWMDKRSHSSTLAVSSSLPFTLLHAGLACALVAAPYLLLQFYLARRFCSAAAATAADGAAASGAPQPPYCDSTVLFPHVYAHVQRQYWSAHLPAYGHAA